MRIEKWTLETKIFPLEVLEQQCPHVAEIIFSYFNTFDTRTLRACRAVSRGWMEFIDYQTPLWTRMSLHLAARYYCELLFQFFEK